MIDLVNADFGVFGLNAFLKGFFKSLLVFSRIPARYNQPFRGGRFPPCGNSQFTFYAGIPTGRHSWLEFPRIPPRARHSVNPLMPIFPDIAKCASAAVPATSGAAPRWCNRASV